MRGNRTAAPRPSRARTRGAAVAAFVVLAALVPAAASALGTQEVDLELPYVCDLPSGKRAATARISATFPDRVERGEAFSPTGVTTAVELPAEAVADLTALGAVTARAATRLTVGVAQGEATAEATWHGTAQPVALPDSGPLTPTATGDVPTVTGRGDGDLRFSAGNLAVDLALGAADGAATDPGSLTVACSPAGDAPEGGLLATVPVGTDAAGPSGSPSASGAPSGAPDPSSGTTPRDGRGDRAPEVAANPPGSAADRDAPPCAYDEENPFEPLSMNAYITGYSNVKKLKGASLLPVSCVLLETKEMLAEPDEQGNFVVTIKAEGELHHEGRMRTPPFRSTFLSFGFVPTTATMVLEQTGPMTVRFDTVYIGADIEAETFVRIPLRLRVLDLEVNGTPLDVGSGCRTEKPLRSAEPDPANHPGDHLVMYGKGEQKYAEDATGYMLLSGGPLTGEATIPAFTGCGSSGGENLDRLLTASVSGPGNYIKQIQGQTCTPSAPVFGDENAAAQCTSDLQPHVIPVPER
ncbi:DUF6801 domain-containing protein [Streptomyces sp. NPDC126497]|uniref:DUF6801 domain-containing protein n=1 Tax=Streptomyces sp. NPDC126497 TaxID=3155313 RepID=UPI00332011DD